MRWKFHGIINARSFHHHRHHYHPQLCIGMKHKYSSPVRSIDCCRFHPDCLWRKIKKLTVDATNTTLTPRIILLIGLLPLTTRCLVWKTHSNDIYLYNSIGSWSFLLAGILSIWGTYGGIKRPGRWWYPPEENCLNLFFYSFVQCDTP